MGAGTDASWVSASACSSSGRGGGGRGVRCVFGCVGGCVRGGSTG